MKNICFIFLLATFIFSGCEKVIQVDLKEADRKIVVEGFITNDSIRQYIKLSKTSGFYAENTFEPVTGANVAVTDQNGQIISIIETEPGMYRMNNFTPIQGYTYNLLVSAGKEIITAKTTYPGVIPIDSIGAEFIQGGGFYETGFLTYCFFNDPVATENFYRFKLYENNEPVDFLWITDDKLREDEGNRIAFWQKQFDAQDTVEINLMNIDKDTYLYLQGVQEISQGQGGNQSAAPGNPITNIKGNALGIFTGCGVSRVTQIMGL